MPTTDDHQPTASFALLVAADRFSDARLTRLRSPARDLAALAAVLADPAIGGFDVATRLNQPGYLAMEHIEGFFADRRPEDLTLFYFSGHGVKDPSGRLYFVAATTRLDRLAASGISAEFLFDQIESCRSHRIVVLLDCCYSGAYLAGHRPRAADQVDITPRPGRGWAVITSSTGIQYSFEPDTNKVVGKSTPSVFTTAIVEGLRTGDADRDQDGLVSVDDLYDYVCERLRHITPHQTPEKKWGDVRDKLIIARNPRHPGPAPTAVPRKPAPAKEPSVPGSSATGGHRRLIVVFFGLLLAAGGLIFLGDLTALSSLWRVSLPLVGVALFLTAIVTVIVGGRKPTVEFSAAELAQRAEELANAVADRWEADERARRVKAPYPLPVRWDAADAGLMDDWGAIRGTPAGEPEALNLAGELEHVANCYQRVPSARFVVIGAPGAGKSILMARLLLDLHAARKAGKPVPVLFAAASWNVERQKTLRDWLEAELIRGQQGMDQQTSPTTTIARELLDAGLILPVIDGLDEMASEARQRAVSVLNNDDSPFVITSRIDEYKDVIEACGILRGAAVVQLKPLSLTDVVAYLRRAFVDSPDDIGTWDSFLAEICDNSTAAATMQEVFATPLMVFLARSIYGHKTAHMSDEVRTPAELLDASRFPTSAAICGHLLAEFLEVTYEGSAYPPAKVRRWLGYLATNLDGLDIAWWKLAEFVPWYWRALVFGVAEGLLGVAFGMTLIELDRVGPTFVVLSVVLAMLIGAGIGMFPGAPPWRVKLNNPTGWKESITSPVVGLFTVGIAWQAFDHFRGWWPLILAGLIAGCAPGAIVGLMRQGKPGSKTVLAEMPGPVLTAIAGVTVIAVIATATHASKGVLVDWLLVGLGFGVFMGLAYIPAAPIPIQIQAATGLSTMLRTNRVFTLYFVAMISCAYGLVLGSLTGLFAGPIGGLAVGLAFGIGTTAWGRWLVLGRGWLTPSGKLPPRFVAFLNDAYRRDVLRQSGPAYQFRHDLLRQQIVERSTTSSHIKGP